MSERIDAFVVCAPGLEPLALAEVQRLGVRPARTVKGGIECTVTWPQLWSLHLRSRVATRVLVRVQRFRAESFPALEAGMRHIDWSKWLAADAAVEVQSSCDRGSALYHSGAVAERVATAVGRPEGRGQTVMVRIVDDVVTVSLDASGAGLHRRGWRGASGKAPLRETLAATLVVASGWDPRRPLVDPFCGAGTVAIEAAMIARRMSPGRNRSFAFMEWPTFDERGWARVLRGADDDVIDRCPPIVGSDRDDGAIAAAIANAATAGVGDNVVFERRTISDLMMPPRAGWIVTNPPYGKRVGDDVRDLYDRFGQVLRDRASDWQVALMAPKWTPVRRLGIPLHSALHTTNGGIAVDVLTTLGAETTVSGV